MFFNGEHSCAIPMCFTCATLLGCANLQYDSKATLLDVSKCSKSAHRYPRFDYDGVAVGCLDFSRLDLTFFVFVGSAGLGFALTKLTRLSPQVSNAVLRSGRYS